MSVSLVKASECCLMKSLVCHMCLMSPFVLFFSADTPFKTDLHNYSAKIILFELHCIINHTFHYLYNIILCNSKGIMFHELYQFVGMAAMDGGLVHDHTSSVLFDPGLSEALLVHLCRQGKCLSSLSQISSAIRSFIFFKHVQMFSWHLIFFLVFLPHIIICFWFLLQLHVLLFFHSYCRICRSRLASEK